MTQGVVSIRFKGAMLYKVIVGAEGMNAPKVASRVRSMSHIPTVEELKQICRDEDFDPDYLVILEDDPNHWNKPKVHLGEKQDDWDEDNPDTQRYFDTFHVAQFNPRWKYGTADFVEVVDAIETTPIPVPASIPGVCVYCGNPTGDDTSICNDCAIPF